VTVECIQGRTDEAEKPFYHTANSRLRW
jgi:hypothetical protein